ncbi:hypothetical protein [Haloferax mucosum]|uniref:hypothetical protein n=1 Tax=Haloferax mucosum TaxID=403181 RepID=UPI00126744EA|nr:hypothetical protein [Haloferax mucosum]
MAESGTPPSGLDNVNMETVSLAISAVKTFGGTVIAWLNYFNDDEDAVEIFKEKLRGVNIEIGFSESPSLCRPFKQPPTPDWEKSREEVNLLTEQKTTTFELQRDRSELIFIRFTQVGQLVSKCIDIGIVLEQPIEILSGPGVPTNIDSSTRYESEVLIPQSILNELESVPEKHNKVVPGYSNLVGSLDLDWTPYFPPIRSKYEIKGKVRGDIFPGDSILIPLWIATPKEESDHSIHVIANPQNPEIMPTYEELKLSIS